MSRRRRKGRKAPPGRVVLLVLGSLSLLFVLGEVIVSSMNRSLLGEIDERQRFINETVKLSQINSQLIQGLATVSARTGDQQIKGILARQGINFSVGKAGDSQ